jgi:hypothetical protein
MGVISRTVSNALEDLIFFFVLLMLIVLSYAYLGCLLYGKRIPEFSGIMSAVPTMLLTLCGMYDYTSIPASLTTQLFFWSYMMISFFVMLNALLAIIVDAYTQVTQMPKAKDPLPFLIRAFFGCLNKDVLHVNQPAMLSVLEKWVGIELDQQDFSESDGMDDVMHAFNSRPLRQGLPPADYAAFHHPLKDGQENDSDFFYQWKAADDMPLALLDQRLLCLVIEVAEAKYAGISDAGRLSETGRQAMACNILERYGTLADVDGDGMIEPGIDTAQIHPTAAQHAFVSIGSERQRCRCVRRERSGHPAAPDLAVPQPVHVIRAFQAGAGLQLLPQGLCRAWCTMSLEFSAEFCRELLAFSIQASPKCYNIIFIISKTHPQSMQRARALLDGGVAQMVDLPPLPQAQAAGVLPVGPWPGAVSVRTRPARSFLSAN